MNPLRAALDHIAADAEVYGDLDRAIEQAETDRRRRVGLLGSLAAAAAVLVVVVGALVLTRATDREAQPLGPAHRVPLLGEGPIDPGRHRYVLTLSCEAAADCPPESARGAVDIEVTVPAGWQHLPGFAGVITPVGDPAPTEGPDGAGLVLGWTNAGVDLYSQPCRPDDEVGDPDLPVAPGVDDFVDAVQAHPDLDVTAPSDVVVGSQPGRFFTLRAPSDISGCARWRPWDPGFYAQGVANVWDIWVVDVDGVRVLVAAEHFPRTPARIRDQLHAMVASISFGRSGEGTTKAPGR